MTTILVIFLILLATIGNGQLIKPLPAYLHDSMGTKPITIKSGDQSSDLNVVLIGVNIVSHNHRYLWIFYSTKRVFD